MDEQFTCACEKASQSASITGVSRPDELQLWCQVAGINKGKVYGLGSESTKAIGKHLYHESSSSSVHVMREEIEQLKNQLKTVQTERDDMQQRMLNNEREILQNNKMLQMLMNKMGCATFNMNYNSFCSQLY